jgi:hypothetical protein
MGSIRCRRSGPPVGAALAFMYEQLRPAVDRPLLVPFLGLPAAVWRLMRNTGPFGIDRL